MAKKKVNLPIARTTRKRKMVSVRQAIIDRLESLGKSRNWLAETTGLRTATVYDYLSGKQNTRSDVVEAMLTALGLEVRPK